MGWLSLTDPEVVINWEKELYREIALSDPLLDESKGLAGESDGKLVQVNTDLTTKPGGSIRFKKKYRLKGRGKVQDEVLKGTAEKYKQNTFAIFVDTIRHAVEVESPIQQQWIMEDALDESRDGLATWFAERLPLGLHLHATGISYITDDAYTLNNTIAATHSEQIMRPNGKAAGALTSNDVVTVDFVNQLVTRLKLLKPKIAPAETPFGKKYVMFLSNEQVEQLRASNSDWFNIMRSAIQGGRVDDNPIFGSALGCFHDVLFMESDLLPPGLNSGATAFKDKTRRAWVGGAQALTLAYGAGWAAPGFALNKFRWDTEVDDFAHQKQIAATTILGGAAPVFTTPGEASARQNAIVVAETYADYGSGLSSTTVYDPWLQIAGTSVEA